MPGVFKLVLALFVRADKFWRWLIRANIPKISSIFLQILKKVIAQLMPTPNPLARSRSSMPPPPSHPIYPQDILCLASNEPSLRPHSIPTASFIVSDYDEPLAHAGGPADIIGTPIYGAGAEIVNDISRRTFSLQPGGPHVVVTPSMSTLHLDHNVAIHAESASLNPSDDIASDIFPIMPSKLPRYARNRIMLVNILSLSILNVSETL